MAKPIHIRVREQGPIKGYKAFDVKETSWGGWVLQCRGYEYQNQGMHEHDYERAQLCQTGFHFCQEFKNVSTYYDFSLSKRRKYAEVIGNGHIDRDNTKVACTRLEVVRILTDKEVFDLQFPEKIIIVTKAKTISSTSVFGKPADFVIINQRIAESWFQGLKPFRVSKLIRNHSLEDYLDTKYGGWKEVNYTAIRLTWFDYFWELAKKKGLDKRIEKVKQMIAYIVLK